MVTSAMRPSGFASHGGSMTSIREPLPIRVGLVANEPIRLQGLLSIFDAPPAAGFGPLLPVVGKIEDLLADTSIEYILIDWSSASRRLGVLEGIRRARPRLRMIVIGPDGNDDIVMDAIIAGARAYLDPSASPRMVRQAIEAVLEGSIWAPRKLLSKLIDRLLHQETAGKSAARLHLTPREQQVLDLILLARSNREIALELGIEERTVKTHVGKLMRKTGAENRIELSLTALKGSLASKPE
jgi:DNA-binding NarL/FixJ family response regulator